MDNGPVNFDFPLIYDHTKIVFAKRESSGIHEVYGYRNHIDDSSRSIETEVSQGNTRKKTFRLSWYI